MKQGNAIMGIKFTKIVIGLVLIPMMISLTGCGILKGENWRKAGGRFLEWTRPIHSPNAKTSDDILKEIAKAEMSDRKPAVQEMRVFFEDEHVVQFSMRHVDDHWGVPGTAWGIIIRPDETVETFNANVQLRRAALKIPHLASMGRDVVRKGDPELPVIDYPEFKKWITDDDKTMYMHEGIDLYALRVLIALDGNLGIDSEVIGIESVSVEWQ